MIEKQVAIKAISEYKQQIPENETKIEEARRSAWNCAISVVEKVIDNLPSIYLTTPCDLCIFNPPSSFDTKPCAMCPAEGRINE